MKPIAIISTTPVLVCENPGKVAEHPTTWGEFCEANIDGIDRGERLVIACTIAVGETYSGGGDARSEWTIRLADDRSPSNTGRPRTTE